MYTKYAVFMILVFFIMFMTVTVDSVDQFAVENTISDYTTIEPSDDINDGYDIVEDESKQGILSILSTFWKLLTFRIDGLPNILVLLIFYPANLMAAYMLVDILKDLVPFT